MGHIRLGILPKTARWKQVIKMLEAGESVSELVQASFNAAQTGLYRVPNDEGFTQTLTVIFTFIDAVQSRDPVDALRRKDFDIFKGATLFEYIGSFKSRAEEAVAAIHAKSDIAEIARDSFADVLMKTVGPSLETLFGFDSTDTQRALQETFRGKSLGKTMHEFFSEFTHSYIYYYLGRELPNHVGLGKTFSNVNEHSEFNKAFDLYIRQTIRIADEFTPGWYGKAKYEKRLSREEVSGFAHVAFKKIANEIRRDAEAYG